MTIATAMNFFTAFFRCLTLAAFISIYTSASAAIHPIARGHAIARAISFFLTIQLQ
jgi:hypothetical protein